MSFRTKDLAPQEEIVFSGRHFCDGESRRRRVRSKKRLRKGERGRFRVLPGHRLLLRRPRHHQVRRLCGGATLDPWTSASTEVYILAMILHICRTRLR
jgi:hypothetical protein